MTRERRIWRGSGAARRKPAVILELARSARVQASVRADRARGGGQRPSCSPSRSRPAIQWGGARSREEVELLGPRVTTASYDENTQPSQHRVAIVTRRAVQARIQVRQQRSANRAEQTRTHELAAAPTSGYWPVKPASRPAGHRIANDPTASTGSVIVNADLLRRLRDGR